MRHYFLVCVAFFSCGSLLASETVRVGLSPALSPDGTRLAFAWGGDIWTVNSNGGTVRPLTSGSSTEATPIYSPDGKQIAFISDRAGGNQVFVMRAAGGTPRQITHHTQGYSLQDWYPDGRSVLVSAQRDHFWREPQRFFRVDVEKRTADQLLFDAYGDDGRLSADGRRLVFTREGERWWRKGYQGSRASQVWSFDSETNSFSKLIARNTESRTPFWHPAGKGFYYVSAQSGSLNLWYRNLETEQEKQLTQFEDDSVISPCISRDGSTVVFSHLFDFYRLRPGADEQPTKLKLNFNSDYPRRKIRRRILEKATDVTFSEDGLEIAFIAGGDLWVMDTELREPIQVTETPEEERDPLFSPSGEQILYVSDADGECDIRVVERDDAEKFWWQNETFTTRQITHDVAVEYDLKWSPAGDRIAYLRERGDLWVSRPDGSDPRRIVASWNSPQYDWSPDGKWLVYAVSDSDFNRDVFVVPVDNSQEPFNLSRHPDNDNSPVWSPDGRMIAFTGRRVGDDVDIYFVFLRAEDSEANLRDRTMEKAIEKIRKARKAKAGKGEPGNTNRSKNETNRDPADQEAESKPQDNTKTENGDDVKSTDDEAKLPEVQIDFDGIHERLRRVSIVDVDESDLFWSHDSSKLAFNARIDGQQGTYTISPPDELKPKLLSSKTGGRARWISQGDKIVWLSDGIPASLSAKGSSESYSFSARQVVNVRARQQAAFDQCWRAMRDRFYDGNMNNRNWDEVRRKYREMARDAIDTMAFVRVVNLMLGELNASHLGFSPYGDDDVANDEWRPTTAHLGVRFEQAYRGPGLKIRDVLPEGPASRVQSLLQAGEIILSIDGTAVDPAQDLTEILNGPLARDIKLRVRGGDRQERDVILRPISYSAARGRLYEKWIDDNQLAVETASAGKLGYLHIRSMNMSSFHRFERELYSVGAGRDGIIIDVRENGGGFTTDHLLTALTQPTHAITVPRDGSRGYPQDRSVYATWRKPIVVLCNQNSFSNAEIFSHAIKTLKRGKLVGVPTAGGVISTGRAQIMDVGSLRMPFRGWYVKGTGLDMELNGAVPHHIIWPQPGELPRGNDKQLEKAIQVLKAAVKKWEKRPQPPLKRADTDADTD